MAAAPADPRGEDGRARRARARRTWYWLLLLPFIALLAPPLYAHDAPRIFGVPFFYWYQVVWLLITGAISTLVYRRTR